jgi:hypothetical protein
MDRQNDDQAHVKSLQRGRLGPARICRPGGSPHGLGDGNGELAIFSTGSLVLFCGGLVQRSLRRRCHAKDDALREARYLMRRKCIVHFVLGPNNEKIDAVAITACCKKTPSAAKPSIAEADDAKT